MKLAWIFPIMCLTVAPMLPDLARGTDTPEFPEPVNSALPMVGTDASDTYQAPQFLLAWFSSVPIRSWKDGMPVPGMFTEHDDSGFSHAHLSGTGCGDLGDVLFMPTVGDSAFDPSKSHTGYGSSFSHKDELPGRVTTKSFCKTPRSQWNLPPRHTQVSTAILIPSRPIPML